jgi:NADH:ubiquinone oxidoreductase subunit 2 (subunit N)
MYYIRVIKLMFFKVYDYWTFLYDIKKHEAIVISITFLFNLIFFIYPNLFVLSIYNLIFNIIL